ncbi:GLABRA2 expression modulator isoform X2 [Citrus sinensis]|uniref:GLABRA2 expression modulator isoform X2 n=1 Tax=Citrus sinensis TaxID=2711 RepID=UPI0003D76AB4|nr:GLABRA2 expression modulator isoform X2 [Citrus sinensis]
MDQQQAPPKAAAADTDHNETESPAPNPKPDPNPNGDNDNWANIVMGSESEKVYENENQVQPQSQIKIQLESSTNSSEPSPASSASKKSVHWSPDLVTESHAPNTHNYQNTMPPIDRSNPYVAHTPALPSNSFSFKGCVGRWGKKVGEATKKAEDLAGNTWQHREIPILPYYGFARPYV